MQKETRENKEFVCGDAAAGAPKHCFVIGLFPPVTSDPFLSLRGKTMKKNILKIFICVYIQEMFAVQQIFNSLSFNRDLAIF